jgi:hypothetical protein
MMLWWKPWVSLFPAVVWAAACAAEPARVCSAEGLAQIEAHYITEAVAACAGHTADACPALPAIKDKYKIIREDWVRCQ